MYTLAKSKEKTPLLGSHTRQEQKPISDYFDHTKNGRKLSNIDDEEIMSSCFQQGLTKQTFGESTFVRTFEIHPSTINPNGSLTCTVCQKTIQLAGRHHQHVVKCNFCKEAMPIKKAPIGRKYIRCLPPCNCLLICKQNSMRIKCPRPNCLRTLQCHDDRPESRLTFLAQAIPGIRRVECGNCFECFLWNIEGNMFAQCPHCNRRSAINKKHKQRKVLKYLILSLLMKIVAFITMWKTLNQTKYIEWFIASYAVLFAIALVLLGRSVFYIRMKESQVDVLA